MDVSERIKYMREVFGKTQKEMAATLGVAPRTWQNYEEGVHEPSWKVLDGLAKLGVNANWLLTGEGRPILGAWNNSEVPGLGERIKILRGTTDKKSFVDKFNIDEVDLSRYENEEESPDVNFLAKLCKELRINPAWLLLGKLPKTGEIIYKNEEVEFISSIDVETLRDILLTIKESILELIDEGLCDESFIVDLEKNAELIAYMYEDSLEYELKGKPLTHKKAKVKRLFGIARDLKGG